MPFGSVLSRLEEFRLDAADGQRVSVKNTGFTRLALGLFGVPHMGLRIRASIVMAEVEKCRPGKIIDAGSGNGLYTLELAANGYVVHGMEVDPSKVSRVEKYARQAKLDNAHCDWVDLTQHNEADVQADCIVCSDVLEHIENDLAAVKTLRALIRPGGTLIVTVPRVSPFSARVENRFDHVRVGYTEEGLSRLLEDNGFGVITVGQFFKTFGRMAWALDRSLRKIPALKTLAFWPLFLLSKLDTLLPPDANAGGIYLVAAAADDR